MAQIFSSQYYLCVCVMMATILATDIMHFDTCIQLHQFPFHHHADMDLLIVREEWEGNSDLGGSSVWRNELPR